jgi:uncharacterized protein with NRDE domain
VCLLIALFQVLPEAPLIIAANRDELYERPAVAMTVLRDHGPRILGGRDEQAGGTWLAVNEYGVVAGLTNQPSAAGRDPSKRSRGELPLAFAAREEASAAVPVNPADYNPCWMLVGDRHSLFSVGVGAGAKAEVEQLGPGLHILENAPLRARSAKAVFVEGLVKAERDARPKGVAGTIDALEAVLRIHEPAVSEARTDETGRTWPPELSAPCVHTPTYGTRSSMTVCVPTEGRPVVRVAAGRPCETSFLDVSRLWAEG